METMSRPPGEAAFSDLMRLVTWDGEEMLRRAPVSWSRSNRITPPRPWSRMALTIQSSGPTLWPRNPTTSRLAIFLRTPASSKAAAPGLEMVLPDGVACDAFGVAEPEDPGWPGLPAPEEVPPG